MCGYAGCMNCGKCGKPIDAKIGERRCMRCHEPLPQDTRIKKCPACGFPICAPAGEAAFAGKES